jgi:CBS domain-containing protein
MGTSSEFDEAYDDDEKRVRGAILTDAIRELPPKTAVTMPHDTPVGEAIAMMQSRSFGALLITDAGRLCGIFTERDVLKKIAGRAVDLARTPVEALMTRDPETLRPEHPIAVAMNRMQLGGYRHIPIVDRAGAPVGIVSVRDIVEYIIRLFPQAVLNLPPDDSLPVRVDGG